MSPTPNSAEFSVCWRCRKKQKMLHGFAWWKGSKRLLIPTNESFNSNFNYKQKHAQKSRLDFIYVRVCRVSTKWNWKFSNSINCFLFIPGLVSSRKVYWKSANSLQRHWKWKLPINKMILLTLVLIRPIKRYEMKILQNHNKCSANIIIKYFAECNFK